MADLNRINQRLQTDPRVQAAYAAAKPYLLNPNSYDPRQGSPPALVELSHALAPYSQQLGTGYTFDAERGIYKPAGNNPFFGGVVPSIVGAAAGNIIQGVGDVVASGGGAAGDAAASSSDLPPATVPGYLGGGGAAAGGGGAATTPAVVAPTVAKTTSSLLSKSWLGPLLQVGGELAGAAIQSSANTDAAKIQAQSAKDALDFEKQTYGDLVGRLQPYMTAGASTEDRMHGLLSAGGSMVPRGNMPTASYGSTPAPMVGGGTRTVMMRAPNGQTKAVPVEQVDFYTAKGAQIVPQGVA